jgi:hypothetical protein
VSDTPAPAAAPAPAVGWYDHPTSKPSPAIAVDAPPPPSDLAPQEQKLASTLHDADAAQAAADAVPINLPENIADLRASDTGWHEPTSGYMEAITGDDLAPEPEGTEPTPAAVKTAALNEVRRMFHDCGLASVDARQMVDRAKALGANPPTSEARAEMHRVATQRLLDLNNQDAGSAQADLNMARQLATRDPRVAALLDRSGLGDDPATIDLFVRLARQQRMQGRL